MQWQNANTAFDANAAAGPSIPVCELLGSFSYALDLTEGQPPGHSLRAAFIAVSMARAMGLSDADCLTVHYATVMKDLGCSSNAARIAALYLADDRCIASRTAGRARLSIGIGCQQSGDGDADYFGRGHIRRADRRPALSRGDAARKSHEHFG